MSQKQTTLTEPLTAPQWAFYRTHRGSMVAATRLYCHAAPEEDLLDWGSDGLMKAARTFDGRSSPSTWVWHCVRFEIRHRLARRMRQRAPEVRVEDADALAAPEDGFAAVETRALLDALAAQATPTQRRILAALRESGTESLADVARRMGCSVSWVSYNLQRLRRTAHDLGLTPGENLK